MTVTNLHASDVRQPPRMRRVNVAQESSDDAVQRVLPAGYMRPADQRQWRSVMTESIDAALFRVDRDATTRAVATALMCWADWDTLTTRPTWDTLVADCRRRTGRGSRRTIARAIATLIELHLIARVSHGRRGCFAPGGHLANAGKLHWSQVPDQNSDGDPDNETAVYVLLVPSTMRLVVNNAVDIAAVDGNGTPPDLRIVSETHPTHAREASPAEPLRGTPPQSEPLAARALSGAPRRRLPLWLPHAAAQGQDNMSLAAAEFRRWLPILQRLSVPDVRSLLRPFLLAGWTLSDVLHALDWRPDGSRWPHDGDHGISPDPHRVRGWFRYRLGPWVVDGVARRSPSQRRRADHNRTLALQQRRREVASQQRQVEVGFPAELRAVRQHLMHQRLSLCVPECSYCMSDAALVQRHVADSRIGTNNVGGEPIVAVMPTERHVTGV